MNNLWIFVLILSSSAFHFASMSCSRTKRQKNRAKSKDESDTVIIKLSVFRFHLSTFRLTSAAYADEASLSSLLFALFSVLNAWQNEKIFVILHPHTEIPS